MGLNMYSFVDLNKSPYVAEMEALKDKELSADQMYYNPAEFDKSIGDVSMIEARLVRLILHLVDFDKNYTGVVELADDVIDHFAVGTKFKAPMLYNALKLLKSNANADMKPLIMPYGKRSRIYWVNPAIACKKSLIDKFVEQQQNAPEVVVVDDESEENSEANS